MLRVTAALVPFLAMASFATAQEQGVASGAAGGSSTIRQLLAQGYEIRSSVPNGSKFLVFMQKDKSAYACEFVTVTRSRCESLN